MAQNNTVAQAAEQLGLSESTIRAWIGQRRIGFVRLGRAVRIPAAEIERLMERGYVPPIRVGRGLRAIRPGVPTDRQVI